MPRPQENHAAFSVVCRLLHVAQANSVGILSIAADGVHGACIMTRTTASHIHRIQTYIAGTPTDTPISRGSVERSIAAVARRAKGRCDVEATAFANKAFQEIALKHIPTANAVCRDLIRYDLLPAGSDLAYLQAQTQGNDELGAYVRRISDRLGTAPQNLSAKDVEREATNRFSRRQRKDGGQIHALKARRKGVDVREAAKKPSLLEKAEEATTPESKRSAYEALKRTPKQYEIAQRDFAESLQNIEKEFKTSVPEQATNTPRSREQLLQASGQGQQHTSDSARPLVAMPEMTGARINQNAISSNSQGNTQELPREMEPVNLTGANTERTHSATGRAEGVRPATTNGLTNEQIIAAAQSNRCIEWNPAKYPGIYILPPANDDSVSFFKNVCAQLDMMLGTNNGIARTPSANAVLKGLSAQHLMYQDKVVVITSTSKYIEKTQDKYACVFAAKIDRTANGLVLNDDVRMHTHLTQELHNRKFAAKSTVNGLSTIQHGPGVSVLVFVKGSNDIAGQSIALAHELVHAHHFMHGNVYAHEPQNPGIPFESNSIGWLVTEEVRTRGIGKYIESPLSENAISIELGHPYLDSYDRNFGYHIEDPWENNTNDAVRKITDSVEVPRPTGPKTSSVKLMHQRELADANFLSHQLDVLQQLQRSTQDQKFFPDHAVRIKWSAQYDMYREVVRLSQKGRYSAAAALVRQFPNNMLALTSLSKLDQGLEINNLSSLVLIRYRENIQGRFNQIKSDCVTNKYYWALQSCIQQQGDLYVRSTQALHKMFGVSFDQASAAEISKQISLVFDKLQPAVMSSEFVDNDLWTKEELCGWFDCTLEQLEKKWPSIVENFHIQKPHIDAVFLYQLDRSEVLSEEQIKLARGEV
jgi:hypothetical protein